MNIFKNVPKHITCYSWRQLFRFDCVIFNEIYFLPSKNNVSFHSKLSWFGRCSTPNGERQSHFVKGEKWKFFGHFQKESDPHHFILCVRWQWFSTKYIYTLYTLTRLSWSVVNDGTSVTATHSSIKYIDNPTQCAYLMRALLDEKS